MFNWFKRNNQKKFILSGWDIDDVPGFEKIENTDSIQYVNEAGRKAIYLSMLTVSSVDISQIDAYVNKPTITEDANGWQLKGAKKSKNQILVCVISIRKQEDIEWAKQFFNSIKPS